MALHVATWVLWSIAGMCLVATIYPYAIYPVILRALAALPVHRQELPSDHGREFALLFCAYNEAKSLPFKLANLRALRNSYPDLEILAYDDCSSDGTAEMLEAAEVGIRVVRGKRRAGKAHGMKLLVSQTDREILVFTDANVELAPEALDQLRGTYADPAVGGVCGLLRYVDVGGTPTAHAGGLYWRLEELVKSLESRSGNVMGADGAIFSIRRELYPDFPDTLLDDLTVSMSVIFEGRRLVKDPLVVASEQLVTSRDDDFRRRTRIATRCFHTHLWMRSRIRLMPAADRWRYWSHRYLRWNGAFFLIVGFLTGLIALAMSAHWLASVAVLAATALIATLGTYVALGPVSALVHMTSSILLTGLGVVRARRGRTVTIWKPPTR